MDPYLEAPTWWPGVHFSLLGYAREALNASLPRGYVANVGERLYIVQPERNLFPDVVVLHVPPGGGRRKKPTKKSGTLVVDPPRILIAHPMQVREPFIEIQRAGEPAHVLITIEILSPANKAKGHPGRKLYRTKQRELLRSQTNLLEIDLLRRGQPTVAVPLALLALERNAGYVVCLHRAGQGKRYEVWEIGLRQRLPRVSVPLDEGDPDVALDLQAVFDRCYDLGVYASQVNYRRDPTVRLSDADAAWADTLLRQKGLRKQERTQP
jgi:hypothetical protein